MNIGEIRRHEQLALTPRKGGRFLLDRLSSGWHACFTLRSKHVNAPKLLQSSTLARKRAWVRQMDEPKLTGLEPGYEPYLDFFPVSVFLKFAAVLSLQPVSWPVCEARGWQAASPPHRPYRGTSLIRNTSAVRTYSSPTPRDLW